MGLVTRSKIGAHGNQWKIFATYNAAFVMMSKVEDMECKFEVTFGSADSEIVKNLKQMLQESKESLLVAMGRWVVEYQKCQRYLEYKKDVSDRLRDSTNLDLTSNDYTEQFICHSYMLSKSCSRLIHEYDSLSEFLKSHITGYSDMLQERDHVAIVLKEYEYYARQYKPRFPLPNSKATAEYPSWPIRTSTVDVVEQKPTTSESPKFSFRTILITAPDIKPSVNKETSKSVELPSSTRENPPRNRASTGYHNLTFPRIPTPDSDKKPAIIRGSSKLFESPSSTLKNRPRNRASTGYRDLRFPPSPTPASETKVIVINGASRVYKSPARSSSKNSPRKSFLRVLSKPPIIEGPGKNQMARSSNITMPQKSQQSRSDNARNIYKDELPDLIKEENL